MTGLVWKPRDGWRRPPVSVKFLLYVLLLFRTYTQKFHPWQFVLRPLFRVWINVLMLKQLKLPWSKMLEVYIATDSATDSINLRHCSKVMLRKSLNFVLTCSAGVLFGRMNVFLAKAPRWNSKSEEKMGRIKRNGEGGGGRGEEREEKNACPKTLLKWETPPNWSRLTAVPEMSSRPNNNKELLHRKQASLPIK